MNKYDTSFKPSKYLPWIGNKKMFAAIMFTKKLVEDKRAITLALKISSKYYEVDQDKVAEYYSTMIENIKLEAAKPKQQELKIKISRPSSPERRVKCRVQQPWEITMTALENVVLQK